MLRNARRAVGRWLRRAADWIDPPVQTRADVLYPLALDLVTRVEGTVRAGSIKHLTVMKAMENITGASRLDINEAIERAVRDLRARHGD